MPLIVTIVAILFTDLLKGVGIGFFFLLKANANIAYFPVEDSDDEQGTLHLNLAEHVTFLYKVSIV